MDREEWTVVRDPPAVQVECLCGVQGGLLAFQHHREGGMGDMEGGRWQRKNQAGLARLREEADFSAEQRRKRGEVVMLMGHFYGYGEQEYGPPG